MFRGNMVKTKRRFARGPAWGGWDRVVHDLEVKEGFVAALRAKVIFDLVYLKQ